MPNAQFIGAGIIFLAGMSATSCRPQDPGTAPKPGAVPVTSAHSTTNPAGPELQVADLQNVHALSAHIMCGSGPETEEHFKALAAMGVKTVISVDGAKPNVEAAEKFGLRYVHLPYGYDGIPRNRELEIGRAVRDLPGPIYIHCHHGKHRGPAGAVVAAMTTEGWTKEQAVAALKVLGTSPHYQGLYAAAANFVQPTQADLDAADATFPKIAPSGGLVDQMVEIDNRWERLKLAQKAGWHAPEDHPDIDPPHEALMLMELMREAHRRTSLASTRPADLIERMSAAEKTAESLEQNLRAADKPAIEKSAKAVDESCTSCHNVYRDNSSLRRSSRP